MIVNEITEWFVQPCGIARPKAVELSKQLNDEFWISDVASLASCLESSPSFLEQLNIPHLIQINIKSHLFTKLQNLTVSDVECLLRRSFMEEQHYADSFRAAKINGTVLCMAKNRESLKEWGISNAIHADAFFHRLEQWRDGGISDSFLRSIGALSCTSRNCLVDETSRSSKYSDLLIISESRLSGKEGVHCANDRELVLKRSANEAGLDGETNETKTIELEDGELEENYDSETTVPMNCVESSVRNVPDNSEDNSVVDFTPMAAKQSEEVLDTVNAASPKRKFTRFATLSTVEPERVTPRFPPPPLPFVPFVHISQEFLRTVDNPKILGKPPTAAPGRRTANNSNDPSSHLEERSEMVVLAQKIVSGSSAVRVKALATLHKIIVDDPGSVTWMRSAGAVDTILDIVADPGSVETTVLISVLDVINTIIALARDASVEYIMDKGVVNSVLPLCAHASLRVRLLAAWIVGNAGTVYFKDAVIRPAVINALVEGYATKDTCKAKEQNDLRDRYAETIKQLCSGSISAQFHTLRKCLPIVVDILSHDDCVDTVAAAAEALNHLIDRNGTNAVDAFIELGVLFALIDRLRTSKPMLVFNCLRALAFIAACCNEEQLSALDGSIQHLQQLVCGTEEEPPRPKVFNEACLLTSMLSKHGERSIRLIMSDAPGVIPQLFDTLNLRTVMQVKLEKVNPRAQNAALALMYIAQRGSNAQLANLLNQGLYTLCFRILNTFDNVPNILVQTLKALRRLVVKVENIGDMQRGEDGFNAERTWDRVRALKHVNKAGTPQPSALGVAMEVEVELEKESFSTAVDSDSALENDSQSTTDAKVRKYATRLFAAAMAKGLVRQLSL